MWAALEQDKTQMQRMSVLHRGRVMKKGATWIDRSIIESPYCVGLCQSEEQFQYELKRMKVKGRQAIVWIEDGKSGQVHQYESTDGSFNRVCIVCIRPRKGRSPSDIIGLLIHEAVHVWQYICELINEDRPSKEFEAYSIQCIAQNLIEAYNVKMK